MSDENTVEHDVTAPPIVPVGPVQVRQASWPVVLGEIGIFFACLCLLGLGCGALVMFTLPSPPPSGPNAEWIEAAQPPMWLTATSLIGLFTLAILLLVGSIRLKLRHAAGATMCRWWAWIFPLWIVAGFVVRIILQPQAPTNLQVLGPDQHIGGVVGLMVMLVLPFIWPAFLIYWFLRPKVRDEVRSWRNVERGARNDG